TRVPDDAINYLAFALRAHIQDLVTSMITAAQHRTSTQFDRPASLYTDNQPILRRKAEREEETRIRRERKELAKLAAAAEAALGAGLAEDDEGGAKKKRRKEGPG
ncbi:hypothetical protein F5887DRAFT_1042603, partial [Amanita rubescens]